ncbi:MAG TPA: cytochrome C oxidase subunit IV family protein [Pseudobdellovibrionaceae bacterium]|nr:cytochrome C oxidase subunit IV family protein [Pseudobdellovibrionaceae bacterium]
MSEHSSEHSTYKHTIPFNVYVKVALSLFALTLLTVIASRFHGALGVLAAPVAFLIASVKAALVLLYFMHLKYDNKLNRVIFGTGFIFLFILFVFAAGDIFTRIAEKSTL